MQHCCYIVLNSNNIVPKLQRCVAVNANHPLAQNSVAMLEQCHSKKCRNNVATVFCAKNRRYVAFRADTESYPVHTSMNTYLVTLHVKVLHGTIARTIFSATQRYNVGTMLQALKQCRNNVAALCCAKNRRRESSLVTSPFGTIL